MKKLNNNIELISTTNFETSDYGTFEIFIFKNINTLKEHLVLKKSSEKQDNTYCRIQSECLTGMVFDSNSCDCNQQHLHTMNRFSNLNNVIYIFLREEGRGHGLGIKIKGLHNKNKGCDTFEAIESLGLKADIRTYEDAFLILRYFQINSIINLTNNPEKNNKLREFGINIIESEYIPIKKNPNIIRHIEAKIRLGHIILDKDDC